MRKILRILFHWLYVVKHAYPKSWAFFKAVVVGLPPSVLGYSLLSASFDLPLRSELNRWLGAHPFFVIAFVVWPYTFGTIFELFDRFLEEMGEPNELKKEEWAAVFTAIQDIVGRKTNRFGAFVTHMQRQEVSSEEAFRAITQPEEQMKSMLSALHSLFRLLLGGKALKIVLAEMSDGQPQKWFWFMPNDDPPSNSILGDRSRNTAYAHATELKRYYIIPDIEKHIRRKGSKRRHYCATGDPERDCGSLICYPVFHRETDRIVYVLSIKAPQPNLITSDFYERYRFVFDAFVKRILLEYNLKLIKDTIEGDLNYAIA